MSTWMTFTSARGPRNHLVDDHGLLRCRASIIPAPHLDQAAPKCRTCTGERYVSKLTPMQFDLLDLLYHTGATPLPELHARINPRVQLASFDRRMQEYHRVGLVTHHRTSKVAMKTTSTGVTSFHPASYRPGIDMWSITDVGTDRYMLALKAMDDRVGSELTIPREET